MVCSNRRRRIATCVDSIGNRWKHITLRRYRRHQRVASRWSTYVDSVQHCDRHRLLSTVTSEAVGQQYIDRWLVVVMAVSVCPMSVDLGKYAFWIGHRWRPNAFHRHCTQVPPFHDGIVDLKVCEHDARSLVAIWTVVISWGWLHFAIFAIPVYGLGTTQQVILEVDQIRH